MAPGARYGAFFGVAFVVFTRLAPQPMGSVIFWSFFALQLSWFALTCWRRAALPFASAAGVTGAVMSICFAVLAAIGHSYPDWPRESWVLLAGSSVLGPLFLFIESRTNRSKWQQWALHTAHKSVWDIMACRHIPRLRNGDQI